MKTRRFHWLATIMTKTTGQRQGVLQGEAEILWKGEEYRYAHELLEEKYPEYRSEAGGWKEGDIPIIKITPTDFGKWSAAK